MILEIHHLSLIELLGVLTVLALFWVAQQGLRRALFRSAVSIRIRTGDEGTEAFGPDGHLMFRLNNIVTYTTGRRGARIIHVGTELISRGSHVGQGPRTIEITAACSEGIRGMEQPWKHFIAYCIYRLRKECRLPSWKPLRIEISNALGDEHDAAELERQVFHRMLPTFGVIRVTREPHQRPTRCSPMNA
jgi:hypothetical protein